MNFETRWDGEEKLVISIDCGTTCTGVAYAHLLPKGLPIGKRVTDWPHQGGHKGEAKIPTMIWYDNLGVAQAFGAHAKSDAIIASAERKGWKLAQNFKLRLHPANIKSKSSLTLDPIPSGVTIERIYADFFSYLFGHTRDFFMERELQGRTIWQDLAQKKKIEFVIAHPNGWGGHEQAFLRKAAVDGGLVSKSDASNLVHMIRESEASVHFVMFHEGFDKRLKSGVNFIVCDVGGSTIDTVLYTVSKTTPQLELKEKRACGCVQAGGIFVNEAAEEFVAAELRRSKVAEQDTTPMREIKEQFELSKKNFSDPEQDELTLRVGMGRMNISQINVERGILTLDGWRVAKFFSFSTRETISSIKAQMEGQSGNIQYLILVGGFGDSQHLRREVKKTFGAMFEVILANQSTAKAVADGAVAWFVQKSVKARATRFAFGARIKVPYSASYWRHNGRKVHHDVEGDFVYGYWNQIVPKDHVFEVNEVIRRSYYASYRTADPYLGSHSRSIYAYTGNDADLFFVVDANGIFISPGSVIILLTNIKRN